MSIFDPYCPKCFSDNLLDNLDRFTLICVNCKYEFALEVTQDILKERLISCFGPKVEKLSTVMY
jgi:hypothetical protein